MSALLCGLLSFPGAMLGAAPFEPLTKITSGGRKYQMSRTADHVMAVGSDGRVHLTYWAGGLSTTAGTPSYIYYRDWTRSGGWNAEQQIDNSDTLQGHIGGRHPSLALTSGGGVWVVWHDHRDGTQPGNWIDQVEIYGDHKPPAGSFSATDVRFTTTVAVHSGDNSYTPKIVTADDGRLSLAWFDFNADAGTADIHLKTSDVSGGFNFGEPFAATRMTFLNDRGFTPSYTVPDLATAPDGTRHLVWAGGEGAGVNLYYAEAPVGATGVTETLLAAGATDYFDPPHIAAGSDGDVWIAWGDDATPGGEDVKLLRRRAGQPGFDPAINITGAAGRQYSVDLKTDQAGRVHLVWIDEQSPRKVCYACFDPTAGMVTTQQTLTPQGQNWLRPALALDGQGNAYVAVEQNVNPLNAGEIWFTTNAPASGVDPETWSRYSEEGG